MKIVFIKATPFGRFYFDPETHRGAALHEDMRNPVILGMAHDWDPYADPDGEPMDIDPEAYGKLIEAAERRDRKAFETVLLEYNLP